MRSALTPAQQRVLAQVRAELRRLARYDDESVVHDAWIRQRYDTGGYPTYAPARTAAVRTAWHEAGHAVAALTVGARFSSASIRRSAGRHGAGQHGRGTEGRVRGVAGGGELGFVIDAGGQIAERLMNWTMLERDDALAAWLPTWKRDGGDAAGFRRAIGPRFGRDEVAAWRYGESLLTPRRLAIRQLARALLVHPSYLPYPVVAELVGDP
ncbi:MAG TPA: hypothetical protein VGG25_02365 [Streptosporangiaceae bacterium]|jgi:hypothetical protein